MAKTIEAINRRLGFSDELDLNDIHAMYMVCSFETAWHKRRRSPWCSAFSTDDFKAMEYAEDLKYYWVDGYGHELTYKQACPALNDMLEFFNKYSFQQSRKLRLTWNVSVMQVFQKPQCISLIQALY
jgi:multiple inositol-polyphosphate phosphatase/2,3-bisphosphoglycerate 3-phosphatase